MAKNAAWYDAQDDLVYERASVNVARASFGTPVTLVQPIVGSHTQPTVSDVVTSYDESDLVEDGGGDVPSWSSDGPGLREAAIAQIANDDTPIGYDDDEPVFGWCGLCGVTHSDPI